MDTATEWYKYEKLPPIQLLPKGKTPPYTRLVKIFPGHHDDPLHCSLSIINVEKPPAYEALSYVWGPSSGATDPHVLCDGQPISITPNLDQAMRWLRYENEERVFWIDAICIDQKNWAERARQVGYMRLIYHYASQSIVWLGPKTPGMDIAFEAAERMKMLAKKLTLSTEQELRESYVKMGLTEDEYDIALFYVSELLDAEYFSRIWCVSADLLQTYFPSGRQLLLEKLANAAKVQEIVAAKVCIAKCDDLEIDFLSLLELVPYIVESRGKMLTETPLSFWTSMPFLRQHEIQTGGIDGSIGPMLNVLSGTQHFKATDPKDKVFALFGISNQPRLPYPSLLHTTPQPDSSWKLRLQKKLQQAVMDHARIVVDHQDIPPGLVVDYRKTTMEVYRDLTRYLICVGPRHLDVLSHVQHLQKPLNDDFPRFPSWVPKWNEARQTTPLSSRVFFAGSRKGDHESSHRIYVQDNKLFRTPKEPNILHVEGFVLDRIIKTTELMSFNLHGAWSAEQIWNQLFDFPLFHHSESEVMKSYRTGERMDMAFLLAATAAPYGTLGTGKDYGTMLLIDTQPAEDVNRSALMAKARADAAAFILENTPMETTDLPDYGEINNLAHKGKSADFRRQVKVFAHNRRFFLTSSGYVGIGPKVMQPGDDVCILFGGRVPFILRRMKDHRLFVGDSYVMDDDIMWAKSMEDGSTPKTPVMFELR